MRPDPIEEDSCVQASGSTTNDANSRLNPLSEWDYDRRDTIIAMYPGLEVADEFETILSSGVEVVHDNDLQANGLEEEMNTGSLKYLWEST
jgi:hypothetical protein